MFCRAAMRPAASQVLVEVLEPLVDACSGAKAVWAYAEDPRMPWLRPAEVQDLQECQNLLGGAVQEG
jgi:hypothetical protein